MLMKVFFTSICFALVSGCALLEISDVDVEKQDAQTPLSDSRPGIASGQPAVGAAVSETQSAANQNKNFSFEQVKRIQSHLKQTGFYSGPVDGLADANTESAIRHFQDGCATLKDLIVTTDSASIQRSGTPAKAAIAKSKRGTAEAVRVIQLRLKDAGFDPGPIDGIHGAKTQRALGALNSGCVMVRELSFASGSEKPMNRNGLRLAALASETPDSQLREPSHREVVKSLQTQLRDAGFDPGLIDGVFGPRTRAALQKYHGSLAKFSALR